MSLKGKVAIVTGGAQGIGRATAMAFAEKNVKVIIADINKEKSIEAVSLIKAKGGEANFIQANIAYAPEVKNLIEETLSLYGRLDYCCNNAGVSGAFKPLTEYTEASFDEVMGINLKGVWLCMKYAIPAIIESGGGAVVNIASSFAHAGAPEHYAYVASKHGVVGITKCAALEFVKQGVRVNCICPGGTDTPMIEECRRINPKIIKPILEKHPIGRLADPIEIAKTVLWLCSEDASFVVGSVISVDGGLMAQ